MEPIGIDATGYPHIKKAVKTLLNQYPGLGDQQILFEEIGEESGIAFTSDAGTMVMSEKTSITGHVTQSCQFPFLVVFRTTATREFQKFIVSDFLDSLGKWLCKEPVTIDGTTYKLKGYPIAEGGRIITKMSRGNSYGTTPNENKSQDWVLPINLHYTYEYDI